jgi:Glycoside hydrolase 97.
MKPSFFICVTSCAICLAAAMIAAGCTGSGNSLKPLKMSKDQQTLTSPDGNLVMTFGMSAEGTPVYSLKFNGRPVIDNSKLGLEIRHEGAIPTYDIFENHKERLKPSSLSKDFTVTAVTRDSSDTSWEPVWGEEKSIRCNYRELCVTLSQKAPYVSPKEAQSQNLADSDTKKSSTSGKHDSSAVSQQITGSEANGEGNDNATRSIVIRFRLFNDGLGFRYEFPKQQNLSYFVLEGEDTEFRMSEDLTTWWIAGDYDSNEYRYETTPLSEIEKDYATFDRSGNSCTYPMPVPGVQTPVMMKAPDGGLYVNIHEAALRDYSSMQLEVHGTTFKAHLVPDLLGNRGYLQTPAVSPWRTVIVCNNAPSVLESRLILNLNEPCALATTDWIKPQKFIGVWWEMFLPGFGTWAYSSDPNVKLDATDFSSLPPTGRHAANTANVKKYIDFAAANGIHGILVEGWDIGWEDWANMWKDNVFDFTTPYPDFDFNGLRDYAKSKGVQLVMHNETSSSTANYERRLDRAYKLMEDNNYSVVKSGYVGAIIPRGEHHYGQEMVRHYLYCVQRAADFHVCIDAHEAVRPTGLQRTYPNLLAEESGRGTEFESFSPTGNPPEHTTIMPFTRFMGGPMDYTPGIFQTQLNYYGDHSSKCRVHTTLVKQLALYVVLYSPLQMVADLPENYMRFPDAFQFIKDVPTDWDLTKVLEAEPGDYITTARKQKGVDAWFIGGITDENAREASLSLADIGLTPGKTYTATIYADADNADWDKNPQAYKITTQQVTSSTALSIKEAPGGGFAIEIR